MTERPQDLEKLTPMLRQYFYWKERYRDCVLFFRMGDFYESFYDDAKLIAQELDIALTARDPEKKMPMAGVPYHSVEQYLAKLVDRGYKVAICEQVSQPDGRGLVDRRVVRIVTPGTYLPEEGAVQASLAALTIQDNLWNLAVAMPSSPRVLVGRFPPQEGLSALASFEPREVLVPSRKKWLSQLGQDWKWSLSEMAAEDFDAVAGRAKLCRLWDLQGLEGFGLADGDPLIGVAAALVTYLGETSFSKAGHLQGLTLIRPEGFLHLDLSTQRNLELFGDGATLYSCLNGCCTAFGRRTLRDWIARPLCSVDEIQQRQTTVASLIDAPEDLGELRDLLGRCKDLERSVARLNLRSGSPRDLAALRDTLDLYPQIFPLVSARCPQAPFPEPQALAPLQEALSQALVDAPPRILGASPLVRSGWNPELDQWRSMSGQEAQWLEDYAQKERERTGISKLKVGYNKVFGYFIEISKVRAEGKPLPQDYQRRQTLVNSERYITPELKAYEDRRMEADQRILELEDRIYGELVEDCCRYTAPLQDLGQALSQVDVLAAFGAIALERGYCRPEVVSEGALEIREGRHPVVELALQGRPCIPNDLVMDRERRVALVTGPNMAGKSTYLRMAAMIQIMAQMGSFVPARSAQLPLMDRLFTRIGARDELARGNSTFMVEMTETANILHNVTSRSLVILDEIGRGTATYDGMSIAWSVIEYLHDLCEEKPLVLFATHYHELTALEERLPGLFNLSMAVEERRDGVQFLHQVRPGAADRSYGIEVARIAGLPRVVLKRAQEILERLEEDAPAKGRQQGFAPSVQIDFLDLQGDALIDELASMDPDGLSPRSALEKLYRLVERAKKVRS